MSKMEIRFEYAIDLLLGVTVTVGKHDYMSFDSSDGI